MADFCGSAFALQATARFSKGGLVRKYEGAKSMKVLLSLLALAYGENLGYVFDLTFLIFCLRSSLAYRRCLSCSTESAAWPWK
jgi:hypothetical protein